MLACLIEGVHTKYRVSQRGKWSATHALFPASDICELVGIIDLPEQVYIVQKYPLLASFAGREDDNNETA